MVSYPYSLLTPPPFRWTQTAVTDPRVHEWISTLPEAVLHGTAEPNWNQYDVTILGVPLSRSSLSASAASEHPDAFRRAWKYFYPYDVEWDVDLTPLRVVDLGDVQQHATDILLTHQWITDAMFAMRTHHSQLLPIAIGGDHSITAMLLRGWKKAHPEERIGILQLDTHFDLRSLVPHGPTNGTPIRFLLEKGLIRGEDVVNIGLHGFFNSKSLKEYADEQQIGVITLHEVRKRGIEEVAQTALQRLRQQVDTIYLTVDMDVLDLAFGPAAPAAAPGGMRSDELFAAVRLAGLDPKVKGMDIVCLDPLRDEGQKTVKTAAHVMLTFLSGVISRKAVGSA